MSTDPLITLKMRLLLWAFLNLSIVLLLYLGFTFIAWEFNPGDWLLGARVAFAAFSLIGLIIATVVACCVTIQLINSEK